MSLSEPASIVGALAAEASRLEEDCTYSAKGHFESARTWNRYNIFIGIPAVLAAAAAGVSALKDFTAAAVLLSVFSSATTAVLTFLRPSERASSHQKAGGLYSSVRNRARFFREVEIHGNPRTVTLRKRLKQLCEERNALNEASPEILRPAFERARLGIEAGEAKYLADSSSRTS